MTVWVMVLLIALGVYYIYFLEFLDRRRRVWPIIQASGLILPLAITTALIELGLRVTGSWLWFEIFS